jgi:hypothetical protein
VKHKAGSASSRLFSKARTYMGKYDPIFQIVDRSPEEDREWLVCIAIIWACYLHFHGFYGRTCAYKDSYPDIVDDLKIDYRRGDTAEVKRIIGFLKARATHDDPKPLFKEIFAHGYLELALKAQAWYDARRS